MISCDGCFDSIVYFQVFQLSGVEQRLEAVGLSATTSGQFMKLLVELDLLCGGHVSKLVTISELSLIHI